jgi:hypothetical protein
MFRKNHVIVGSAFVLAAVAVAIDDSHHRLPEPTTESQFIIDDSGTSPCSLDSGSPCSLDESPCSLDASPCSL